MQAASLFDGFSFDLFPPFENGLTAPEVNVNRRQVVQALVAEIDREADAGPACFRDAVKAASSASTCRNSRLSRFRLRFRQVSKRPATSATPHCCKFRF